MTDIKNNIGVDMGRVGGEADKLGNRYEGAWTIHHLLFVLLGYGQSITVEDLGERGEGSEFTFVTRDGIEEVHQVKRNSTANGWSLGSLKSKGVLNAARLHTEAGRKFHFVSNIPAPMLTTLADYARRSADLPAFLSKWLTTEGQQKEFRYLASDEIYASNELAWRILREIELRCQDEVGLQSMNQVLAQLVLEGAAPRAASASLEDLVKHDLGVKFDAGAIEERLERYGLRRLNLVGNPDVSQAVAATLKSWKSSVSRELLSPAIPRLEATNVADTIQDEARKLTIIAASAGSGKSAVVLQAAEKLEAEQWPVLGFRLDRLDNFASTDDLGTQLGLGRSPVAALAAAAGTQPSLLIIDQLDAVSSVSGRLPRRFDVIADLIREAAAFPRMRIVMACRAFDIDNDHRIRQLVVDQGVTRVDVAPLSGEQIEAAVKKMSLPPENLNDTQRALLSSPFNLVLLNAIADQDDALSFSSADGLLSAYWKRKRQACSERRPSRPVQFSAVIGTLANAISERQQLTAPATIFDVDDLADDAEVLASEGILVTVGKGYAFFHEAFFDYAFARLWMNHNQTLVDFLLGGAQELFRRAQVRQILNHLREGDAERFIREVEAVLTAPNVRFHIKVVVLAVLRSLPDPSTSEWLMVKRLLSFASGPLERHLWGMLRTLPWFDRLDDEGAIEEWLASGDSAKYTHAMEVLTAGIKERTDRIAEFITPYAGQKEPYLNWLIWITRFASIHESRPLFELMLQAVRQGYYNDLEQTLWRDVYGLGQHQPSWGVELLRTWLVDRPGALDLDKSDRVAALRSHDHILDDLVKYGSEGAFEQYVAVFVPYLLTVASLTEIDPSNIPIKDKHFRFKRQHAGTMANLDDALLHGAVIALQSLIKEDAAKARTTLDLLSRDHHDTAQWLLYEALASSGEQYADWAGDLLLQGDHRLYCGDISDGLRAIRELITATSSHMSDGRFKKLEAALMAYRPPWEDRQHVGLSSFGLLSAMDNDRLSSDARRRLGELQRRFNRDGRPLPSDASRGGFIASPIAAGAAQKMSDDHWLSAMKKHDRDRTDFASFRGGVHELSQVVREQATRDPARFALLALRVTKDIHPAYANAILQALGQTSEEVDPSSVFDAVRHVAAFQNMENDQSLGMALRKQLEGDVPEDVIEIVLDRALHSKDPKSDLWDSDASGGQPYYGGRIYDNGMNTARGNMALVLGDLVIYDADGVRTRQILPYLDQLAQDPSIAVRSCVAHLIAACMRHASQDAITAYRLLTESDERLLATPPVTDLTIRIGMSQPQTVRPVIERMQASSDAYVREIGGQLAAYAGLEFGLEDLLESARDAHDAEIRKGVASLCAQSLAQTSDVDAAVRTLSQLTADTNEKVRTEAARAAATLRSSALRPFNDLLTTLMASEAYAEALPQLIITLEEAPDRVDDLVALCTERFIEVHGEDASNISTAAAGDAQRITRLIVRAYEQASDAAARKRTLDLIDQLLEIDAIGALDVVDGAERALR